MFTDILFGRFFIIQNRNQLAALTILHFHSIHCDFVSDNIPNLKRERQFLICNSCFWCASIVFIDNIMNLCPVCNNDRLERMPICDNESYTYNCDPKNGIVLYFSRVRTGNNKSK